MESEISFMQSIIFLPFLIICLGIAILVARIIIFLIPKLFQGNINKDLTPTSSIAAKVIEKREVRNERNSTSAYYITFEVEGGKKMEMEVSDWEYRLASEREIGVLLFKGPKYLGFEKNV